MADEKACPHGVQKTDPIVNDPNVIGHRAVEEIVRFIVLTRRGEVWGDGGGEGTGVVCSR